MALPAVTKVIQWGGSDVYKVGGKVFAICGLGGGLSFKVTPIGFVALTEGGPGRQAPYCAKGHWVAIDLDAADDADITDWLGTAHALIAAKLTRRLKVEIGLANPSADTSTAEIAEISSTLLTGTDALTGQPLNAKDVAP